MEEITYEEANNAKIILIKWLQQNIDLDYTELIGDKRAEKLLYLALKQDYLMI